jgi:hypothetical protein
LAAYKAGDEMVKAIGSDGNAACEMLELGFWWERGVTATTWRLSEAKENLEPPDIELH